MSGGPGSGKTTLVHALADDLGCPAIIRDDIARGMVMYTPEDRSGGGGGNPLGHRPPDAVFDVLKVLVRAGASVVVEATFPDRLWRPKLEPLSRIARTRVVHCTVPTSIAHDRIAQRARENNHRSAPVDHDLPDAITAEEHTLESVVPTSPDVPTLTVDTSKGYNPSMEEIISFVRAAHPAGPR
ncbi:AAA family ATPase [Embleya sp. NPDC127516]|uniref:AAA family ATPase n=1 Tax=Embleya sp. NPDC127516 TaxID=3363990 RepID=UPI00382639B0